MRLVDQASALANGDAAAGRIPGRSLPDRRPRRAVGARIRAAGAAALLALAGCAAPPGVPTVHEVPDRPRPTPAAERAALAEEVRAEGARSWAEAQALRSRTGKTALPPPAWLLEPIAPPPVPAATPARPPNPEAAIVAERVRSESDDGSLNSFLRQLVRRQPGAFPAATGAEEEDEDDEPASAPRDPSGRRPPPPAPPALDRFLDQLGGRLAVGRPESPTPQAEPSAGTSEPPPMAGDPARSTRPTTTAPSDPVPAAPTATGASTAGPPPAPAPPRAATTITRPAPRPAPAIAPRTPDREPPAALLPAPSAAGTLPGVARAEFARVVEAARERGVGLAVIGHGATPALALERARLVARLVAEAGLPPGGLAVRAAGPGEWVELRWLPPPS